MDTINVMKKQKAENSVSVENEKKKRRLISMDAYSRHKHLVNEYLLNHVGATSKFKRNTEADRTDYDVLMDNHQFVWDDSEPDTWEKRLAKKYYDRLFKEYCIADLSLFERNKIAMRWRTEKEVLDGKGQFVCGEKRCNVIENLKSWEVNFAYREQGTEKNTLVKLRLCEECSEKLNFREKRKEAKKVKPREEDNSESESLPFSGETSKSKSKVEHRSTGHKRQLSQEGNSPSATQNEMDFISELLP